MSSGEILGGLLGVAIVGVPGLSALTALQGFQIGAALGGLLFPPGLPPVEVGRMNDIRTTGAGQGSAIPLIMGRNTVGVNIVWASPIRHVTKTSGGGKGSPATVTHEYYGDLAIMVCKAPKGSAAAVKRHRRTWAAGEVIYDDRPEAADWGSRVAKADGTRPLCAKWIDRDKVTCYPGSQSQLQDPVIEATLGTANTPAFRGRAYQVYQDFPYHKYGQAPQFKVEVETKDGGDEDLADVVAVLFGEVDYPLARLDLTLLAGKVCHGFTLGGRSEIRNSLEVLAGVYLFDLVEVDFVIKAVPRGGTPSFTIDRAHLGCGTPDPQETLYAYTRLQEHEVPQRVDVTYISAAIDFQAFTQSTAKDNYQLTKTLTMQVPCVLTENEAMTLARRVLFAKQFERDQWTIQVPWLYATICPGDTGYFPDDKGQLRRVRVQRMEIGLFGHLELQLIEDDPYPYTLTGIGAAPPTIDTGNVGYTGLPLMRVFDTNALVPEDAIYPGVYAIMGTPEMGWLGGTARVSQALKRSDNKYVNDTAFVPAATTVGVTTATLGKYRGGNTFDMVNTIAVNILSGPAPLTAAEIDVLNGANVAFVGGELVQWCNAVQTGTNSYTLSKLLRGRKGTEYEAFNDQVTNAEFFILSADHVGRFNADISQVGLARTYYAFETGIPGQNYANTATDSETIVGNSRKPWAPGAPGSSRAGGGDVTFTWQRRSRFGEEWEDGTGAVPLGETTEEYVLEIYTANWAVLKRTITGLTSPTYTYSSANQVTDFGSNQAAICVKVYQVSSVIGNGHPLSAIL